MVLNTQNFEASRSRAKRPKLSKRTVLTDGGIQAAMVWTKIYGGVCLLRLSLVGVDVGRTAAILGTAKYFLSRTQKEKNTVGAKNTVTEPRKGRDGFPWGCRVPCQHCL